MYARGAAQRRGGSSGRPELRPRLLGAQSAIRAERSSPTYRIGGTVQSSMDYRSYWQYYWAFEHSGLNFDQRSGFCLRLRSHARAAIFLSQTR